MIKWKLIFSLSLVGVAVAIAGVFGWMGKIEPFLWLVIFVLYAVVIAKKVDGRFFLHGFLVSVVNGVWIAVIHSLFFPTYMANNPDMIASYEKFPHSIPPQVMMLIVGPIIGVLTGLVAGLFAYIAGKMMKKQALSSQ
jgi:hypothetical protein